MLLKKCAQILQQVQDERSEEVYPEPVEGSAKKKSEKLSEVCDNIKKESLRSLFYIKYFL